MRRSRSSVVCALKNPRSDFISQPRCWAIPAYKGIHYWMHMKTCTHKYGPTAGLRNEIASSNLALSVCVSVCSLAARIASSVSVSLISASCSGAAAIVVGGDGECVSAARGVRALCSSTSKSCCVDGVFSATRSISASSESWSPPFCCRAAQSWNAASGQQILDFAQRLHLGEDPHAQRHRVISTRHGRLG